MWYRRFTVRAYDMMQYSMTQYDMCWYGKTHGKTQCDAIRYKIPS